MPATEKHYYHPTIKVTAAVYRVYRDLYVALNDEEVRALADLLQDDIDFIDSGMQLD